jgi:uncharacterized Zn-binding protein involved in type VI secretion
MTDKEKAEKEAEESFEKAMPAGGSPLMAARITDNHICPMVTLLVRHVGGPILPPACPTVLIGFLPAARLGDQATRAGGPDVTTKGSATVMIGGQPAARLLDRTSSV